VGGFDVSAAGVESRFRLGADVVCVAPFTGLLQRPGGFTALHRAIGVAQPFQRMRLDAQVRGVVAPLQVCANNRDALVGVGFKDAQKLQRRVRTDVVGQLAKDVEIGHGADS